MIKIEAATLEEAYQDAASSLSCSVTELEIEVVQNPSKGFLGLFKKTAIIVAVISTVKTSVESSVKKIEVPVKEEVITPLVQKKPQVQKEQESKPKTPKKREKKAKEKKKVERSHTVLNDTIMPASFVSDQDDEDDDLASGLAFTADYDDEFDNTEESALNIAQIALSIQGEINTLLVEFKGEDAALLIGKEGYRYKALSYMIFNWINTKYDVQLRLEIAEFLKNQEESVSRYLVGVCENLEKDGRAQTKILDGVLVQIALKELRDKYPDKYVVIRSTRDGLKYIIVNDYHSN